MKVMNSPVVSGFPVSMIPPSVKISQNSNCISYAILLNLFAPAYCMSVENKRYNYYYYYYFQYVIISQYRSLVTQFLNLIFSRMKSESWNDECLPGQVVSPPLGDAQLPSATPDPNRKKV
jgi:hypothetical protein